MAKSNATPFQVRCPLIGSSAARTLVGDTPAITTSLIFDAGELLKHVPHPITAEGHHVTLIQSSFLTAIHMDERSPMFRPIRSSRPSADRPVLVFDVLRRENSRVSFETASWEGGVDSVRRGPVKGSRTDSWSLMSDERRAEIKRKFQATMARKRAEKAASQRPA